ncbi:MAG TPA: metal ABC transporter substrate-binding protein, partial [Actinomycetota bacterium]|nr:metal ABC transporter substrate-binding protein [Actinomycetota bacterium]
LASSEQDLSADPHVWLDPVLMQQIVHRIGDALARADTAHASADRQREGRTVRVLQRLDAAYRGGLASCRFTTFVTSHEAFGYLAQRYGLHQLGIEGLAPESEPSAQRIQAAATAIQQGRAAPAVFYEETAEGRRVGQSVAADVGVPALPLGTVATVPTPGDYLSVMRENLSSLEQGLRCAS